MDWLGLAQFVKNVNGSRYIHETSLFSATAGKWSLFFFLWVDYDGSVLLPHCHWSVLLMNMAHCDFEKKVMEMLLAGHNKLFCSLRVQYDNAIVTARDFTGRGFFTSYSIPDALSITQLYGRIDDVRVNLPDEKAAYLFFILYITDGKLDVLECFTTADVWNEEYYRLSPEYCYPRRRDYTLA